MKSDRATRAVHYPHQHLARDQRCPKQHSELAKSLRIPDGFDANSFDPTWKLLPHSPASPRIMSISAVTGFLAAGGSSGLLHVPLEPIPIRVGPPRTHGDPESPVAEPYPRKSTRDPVDRTLIATQ